MGIKTFHLAGMLVLAVSASATVLSSAPGSWCPEEEPHVPGETALHVSKCCFKGQQLDASGRNCVERPDHSVSITPWEFVPVGESLPYWLPEHLAFDNVTHIRASYNRSCTFHEWLSAVVDADNAQNVTAFLEIDAREWSFFLEPFEGRVQPFSVWKQNFCFDATEDVERPLAVVTTLQLRSVFKCCARGQQLDAQGNECVRRPGERRSDDELETLNPWADPSSVYWLPKRLSSSIVEVSYEKGPEPKWNPKNDADDEQLWELYEDENWGYKILTHPTNNSVTSIIDGVTSSYCFDTVEEGALPPKVIVTKVAKVNKCCRQGERLDARALHCEATPGHEGALSAEEERRSGAEETVAYLEDASAAKWLPPHLRRAGVPVRFLDEVARRSLLGSRRRQVFGARGAAHWEIESFHNDVPKLSVSAPTPNGKSVVARALRFCIDVVGEGPLAPRVLIAEICDTAEFACLPKCCPAGELLSPSGYCGAQNGPDWTPLASSLNDSLEPRTTYGGRMLSNSLCWDHRFVLEAVPQRPRDFLRRLQTNADKLRFLTKYYCADFLSVGSRVIETLAYCNIPPSGPLYENVRPLQVVSTVLLGVSVASLLLREDTRASTHGRALATHAACLTASNALQALWFFNDTFNCEIFAFSIYFFLTAAGFWLHVVSVNMARGFGRPLAALERTGGKRKRKARCSRFGLMSAYAWGSTALLTGLCVCAYKYHEMAPTWMTRPSFFETRTCFVEYVYTGKDAPDAAHTSREDEGADRALGALYYYYAPMGLLVLANALCLAVTALRIRRLHRNTSMVRQEGARKASAPSLKGLRTVMLYVKLLVTAGVLELLLEATAWGARRRHFNGPHTEARDFFLHNAYVFEIVGTFVDLGRAVAVSWLCRWRCDWSGAAAWGQRLRSLAKRPLLWGRPHGKWKATAACKPPAPDGAPVVKGYKAAESPL